ncbi:MAG: serpin family protein [Ignavibacteriales bacterium]|nr:serpin family protein [Ignavibacteriales bacterium]
MRKTNITLSAILLVVTLGCRDLGTPSDAQQGQSRPLTSLEQSLVASDNAFGFTLFAAVNRSEPAKNLFISPVSVSMALGMTMNGARGTTKDAMARTLEFGGLSQYDINTSYKSLIALLTGLDPKVKFQIANSIWHRPELNVEQNFKDLNKDNFNAEVNSLDFSDPMAAKTINGWVDRNTNGKIKEIVPDPIPADLVMYLINAIYFKGTWTYRFDSTQTRNESFTVSDGSRKTCRMMSQGGTFSYYGDDEIQAVDLPYGDAGFSATVLLPKSGTNIESFAGALTQQQWNTWIGRMNKAKGDIYLPKFKLEYKKKLNDMLIAMGMTVAFSPGIADFRDIDQRGGPFISEVMHKTFVQVDEEGTEAAAVTSVGVSRTSIGPADNFTMRVDRPFLIVIREHHSGTILFIGKVVDPTL